MVAAFSPPAAAQLIEQWLPAFADSLYSAGKLSNSCSEDCIWRDLLAFDRDYHTVHGLAKVEQWLRPFFLSSKPFQFSLSPGARLISPIPGLTFAQGIISFETVSSYCSAVVTLKEVGDGWLALAVVTILDGLKNSLLDSGVPRDTCGQVARKNTEYDVIVVGAGQAGLCAAAWLQKVGARTLVVEKSARVGDSWRDRYDSLRINTPKSFSHMPFFPFPVDLPQFFNKYTLADHLERYTQVLGMETRTRTTVASASYVAGEWDITLLIDGCRSLYVRSKHLILANGVDTLGGVTPSIPDVEGKDEFKGVIVHSSQFRNSTEWAGKDVVVVGTGCSGHDIAQDLTVHKANVTLVQRSATSVISLDTLYSFFPGLYFGDNIPPTEIADKFWIALPHAVSKDIQHEIMKRIAHRDEGLHCALVEKGYLLTSGDDNFLERMLIRRGGYYIDHGCCGLVINDQLKLKCGVAIKHFSTTGLVFEDGSEIPAHLVVFATGFNKMTTTKEIATTVLGPSVAEQVREDSGWDDEWEFAGLWRPSGHPALWFAGGDLFTSRFYSRLLALQIVMRLSAVQASQAL